MPPARHMKRLFLVIRDSEYTSSLHQLVIQEYLDVIVQWDLIHRDTVSSMDKIRPEHCTGKESSSRRRYSLSYLRDRRTFWRCFGLRAFQFLHRSTEEACFGKQASSFHRRARWCTWRRSPRSYMRRTHGWWSISSGRQSWWCNRGSHRSKSLG